ncbi:hypothetical protein E3A20_14810, partial [Planctomyces bekefii]
MAGSEAGGGGGVNWSAAATVDLFDNMQQRRARWRLLLVSSCLVLLLGVPLWVLRGQLQDAARQTLQGEYDREQARLQGLTSLNPAVRERADRAGALRAGAGAKSADLAIPDLREALDLIDQAEQLARAERGLRELLNPLGETLAGTQWYVSSDWIRKQLASLSEKHQATVTLLDAGEVATAEADAAELLRSLGELQAANVQAMQADVIRRDWQRMLGRVPERLRGDAVYQSLVSRGEQGEGWWKEGKWKDAGLSFGGATAQLQQWLDGDGVLTAEEKAATAALSEGEIARLESEQQVLKNEKAEQYRRRSEYSKQLIAEGRRPPLPETLVAIKGGSFMMGSNAGQTDEKPVHRVNLADFWISQHEETTEEVLVWLNAPGVVLQDGWIDFDSEYCPIRRNGSKYELNTASKFGQSGQQPMVCISQRGALPFNRPTRIGHSSVRTIRRLNCESLRISAGTRPCAKPFRPASTFMR